METIPSILIMNLQTFEPMNGFKQVELRAGMQLLKIIVKTYYEFKLKFKEILSLVSELEETKRIDLLEEMT